RTCYAITELIRRENVDIAIDFHEAELQYPVISTIVAHEKGADLAAAASMFISSDEGFAIGVENSPKALRGLSHREIGDATGAISLLLEAPEPFLDATRGRTDRALLLTGRDEFVVRAGKRGLLFEKIDEKGWPIDVRVGRHTSTVLQILENWTADKPDKGVVVAGVPRYTEVVEKGTGAFLKDPRQADRSRLYYE
ncbi:MAG: succinylglutamate desuccinylase, partial [Acidobacteria bacterium]|nr:succinylglutamate desuccinylase [Acidobacteriota bacterium]